MNSHSRCVDPLFGRHEMMLELGRLDMYIAHSDAERLARHGPDDTLACGCCINGSDNSALDMRARIHETLSAVPV